MAFMTGDAFADASALYDREAEFEKSLPCCCKCKEHIQEDYLYAFDGDLYHEDCFHDFARDSFRKNTEDYMKED